jgi:SAM-dependent methyltransferase
LTNLRGNKLSEEYKRWEGRYSAPEYVFGKEPNYFLAKCKGLLPASGRALAVADGEGRNSVWLAEQGLGVHAIDFSPTGQDKARALARERNVKVNFELADAHTWAYPDEAFDVVCDIFTQFSAPTERAVKWAGMRKALKPGGLLVILGYTPKQLAFGTGGPKQLDHLYTKAMLEEAFKEFEKMRFTEEELEMHEGAAHSGMSAVIGLTCQKLGKD